MKLQQTLVRSFAVAYPDEVAAALESRTAAETAGVLHRLTPAVATKVIESMAPAPAAAVLDQLEPAGAADILTRLPFAAAMLLLRRVSPEGRAAVVEALPAELAKSVRATIDFPAGTAGALMDPRVVAVTSDLTVADAVEALRDDMAASHDDLYIIDRSQALVGVLSLHELLPAKPKATLGSIMMPPVYRVAADARRGAIVGHPGWRHVHSLPVVDGENRFLGAIRYRTFRRLEAESRGEDTVVAGRTAQALSDLFATGLGGFLGAFATAAAARSGTQDIPDVPAEGVEDDQNSQ